MRTQDECVLNFLMLFSLMAHPLLHIEENTVDLVLCTRPCYICIKLNSSEISAFKSRSYFA